MRPIWVFHQGSENAHHYSVHMRKPQVYVTDVIDPSTGETIKRYETPSPFLFMFCVYGLERRVGLKLPLGHIAKIGLETLDYCGQPEGQ